MLQPRDVCPVVARMLYSAEPIESSESMRDFGILLCVSVLVVVVGRRLNQPSVFVSFYSFTSLLEYHGRTHCHILDSTVSLSPAVAFVEARRKLPFQRLGISVGLVGQEQQGRL